MLPDHYLMPKVERINHLKRNNMDQETKNIVYGISFVLGAIFLLIAGAHFLIEDGQKKWNE